MNKRLFVFLLLLCILITPTAFAHEKLADGWHILPKNADSERDKEWNAQEKVWALYKNGKEVKRYSLFLGVHRGWGTAPENSLASFEKVKENGYYGFETDVRFTKDNVAVLCHDKMINEIAVNNDLSVITGADIYVNDLTYNQLKNNYIFNIERLNHETPTVLSNYNTNRITTFEQMLDFVKANDMNVAIELKQASTNPEVDVTEAQIASLVQMIKDKKMNNYVRFISYWVHYLEYVKNADDSMRLGLLISDPGKCDTDTNRYCEGDTNHATFFNRLKTDNNMVWFSPYMSTYNLPRTKFGNNMPSNREEVDALLTSYTLSTIPQGTITVSNFDPMIVGKTERVNYQYDGDGIVKCKSSSPNITCSIDSTHKDVVIKHVGITNGTVNESYTVKVYATQGISYSATNDVSIPVRVRDKKTAAREHVKSIKVKGYDIDFNKDTEEYTIKIQNENKLEIDVELEPTAYLSREQYDASIGGNENLKNGSVVEVAIHYNDKYDDDADDGIMIVYKFRIEQDTSSGESVPDTGLFVSRFLYIVAFLMIISGTIIIGKNVHNLNEK